MTREFIKSQVAKLKQAYEKFNINQSQFDLWCECFQMCNEKDFELAVANYIKGNEFPPTIAGVMKYYREIEDYKREMKEFLFRQYTTLRSTWDERYDKDTMNEFVRMVCNKPKEFRKDFAVEYTHEAVSYHHDCEYEGRAAPTLMDYLKGER
jgi:hypothetical protein